MTISTTKYNEVNPTELKKMFDAGAKLIRSREAIGVFIGTYRQSDGKEVRAYSDDDVQIYNVTLPLSIGGVYDCEVVINDCE